MYTFNYTLDDKDYSQFAIHHFETEMSQRRFTLILRLCAIFMLVITVIFVVLTGEIRVYNILSVAIACLLLFGLPLIMRIAMKNQIKAMKKGGNAPYGEALQIHFGEGDVHSVSKSTETRVKYASLDKVCEDNNAVYIYMNAIQAIVIPRRAFEDEAQKAEFLTFIRNRVGAATCRPS